jgi:alpha-beta hydrolase superfamily lysophospholipase
MIHHETTFSASGSGAGAPPGPVPIGHNIYYQSWMPDERARAVFVLAHGAAEHSGRYDRFARHFVERGYGVVALDFPGHGRSDGTPGHVDRFSDFVDALDAVRARVSKDLAGVPQILLGHSMGGLIATTYLLENPPGLVGCVLSGPAIATDIEPGAFQMAMIRFLSRAFPKFGALRLDADGVSRDPEEVKRYVEDPLNHTGKLSARLVSELFESMNQVQEEAPRITIPLLILHGGADSMASPRGSELLAERAGSSDKTLEIYPELYHEIFNEPEREQVFADIERWCDAHLAPA